MRIDWRLRYGLLALIWGSSFLFIAIGVEVLDPLQVALTRVAIGAATLLTILRVLRQTLPRELPVWGHLMVAGLFYNAVPFSLLAYAGERVPSALSGILNATTPLFTLMIAISVLPSERPTRLRLLGLLTGFFGVLLIFGGGVINELTSELPGGFWTGSVMVLGASICYGVASVYTRRTVANSGYSAVALSAGQVCCATVQLALLTPFVTSMPTELPARVVFSMLALGALGTGVSYILFWSLLRDIGPTMATTVTYLFPIVAVFLGVVLHNEHLTWNEIVGGAVIIAGAAISQRTTSTKPARQTEPPAGQPERRVDEAEPSTEAVAGSTRKGDSNE
jgi:drug/metabolite transporter (DMT)-like permease